MNDNSYDISIIIPAFNEAACLPYLHQEIVTICNQKDYNYEIILIDDGSTDQTSSVVEDLEPLKYIRLRRNFGQTAALDCGIKHAGGDLIVTLDGDGQNDPADIPKLIDYLHENDLDIVSGWRKNRKDPFFKKMSSRLANYARSFIIKDGLNDSGCTLKVYRAECFKGISLYGEMHRFIPAVLKIKGFSVGELEVNHRPRQAGKTKYTWKRGIKGIIDMISVWFWHKYAIRPLHLLGGLGISLIMLGLLSSAIGISFYIAGITLFRFFLPIFTSFLLITGFQIFLFGLMADMISKGYYDSTTDSSYNIKEIKVIK